MLIHDTLSTEAHRHELKFVVDLEVGKRILAEAAPFCSNDPHAGPEGSYEIASTYYDTRELRFFHDRNESVAFRRKLRLRSYNSGGKSDALFIEIKEKHKNLVNKKREVLTSPSLLNDYHQHDRIPLSSLLHFVPESATKEEIAFLHAKLTLLPVTIIRYVRKVLRGTYDSELRITLDQRVTAGGTCLTRYIHNDEYFILPPSQGILEVKAFGVMPYWLSSALMRHGIFQVRFSKYGEAIVQGAELKKLRIPREELKIRCT